MSRVSSTLDFLTSDGGAEVLRRLPPTKGMDFRSPREGLGCHSVRPTAMFFNASLDHTRGRALVPALKRKMQGSSERAASPVLRSRKKRKTMLARPWLSGQRGDKVWRCVCGKPRLADTTPSPNTSCSGGLGHTRRVRRARVF